MRRIRRLCVAVIAAIWAVAPVHAGEIFLCEDGRTIELDSSNRHKLRDDPCVVAWYKSQKAAADAAKAKASVPPTRMQGIPAHCRQPGDCPHLRHSPEPTPSYRPDPFPYYLYR